MIGTPFQINKDEVHNRRMDAIDKHKPEHLQEVRDEQGKRVRFTGAMTGAYKERDVGYGGTVGSKEGWAPSKWVSSRDKKQGAKVQEQSIFQFMDEEDLGTHQAG